MVCEERRRHERLADRRSSTWEACIQCSAFPEHLNVVRIVGVSFGPWIQCNRIQRSVHQVVYADIQSRQRVSESLRQNIRWSKVGAWNETRDLGFRAGVAL